MLSVTEMATGHSIGRTRPVVRYVSPHISRHEFEAVLLDRVTHNDQTVKVTRPPGGESGPVDGGYDPLWEKITGQKTSPPSTSRDSTVEARTRSEGADHVSVEKSNTRRSRWADVSPYSDPMHVFTS